MQLSIIIPTKERHEIFAKTLLAVQNATRHLDAEIIVVNDSKTSAPLIASDSNNIKLITNPKPGVASARNTGARNSSGEILLFLDNDIIVSKESIDHVINLHNQFKMACFNVDWKYPLELQNLLVKSSFGRFMLAHNMTSFKGWYDDPSWQDNALFASTSVASFHLSIAKGNFEKVGGYNEQFPHAGFEDYDFPKKLKNAGLTFYIDSRIAVDHNESDRLGLNNWLNNQERRAITRKVAVNLGYQELKITYGPLKKCMLWCINLIQPLVVASLQMCPNHIFFDSLYFKCVSGLLAARIYKGYTSI